MSDLGKKLWGVKTLSKVLEVSEDRIRRFALDASCPIYRPSGKYFAFENELVVWLRTKPTKPGKTPNNT